MAKNAATGWWLAGLLSFSAVTFAAEQKIQTQPIPAQFQVAVKEAEAVGSQIYQLDRAAWLATDALRDRSPALLEKTRGWITSEYEGGTRVAFLDGSDTPKKIYRIDISHSGGLSNEAADIAEPMSDDEIAANKARRLALSQSWMSCAATYNTSVIPSAQGYLVYLSPGFSRLGFYQAGGYHLYRIDKTGRNLISQRSFTKGCIELSDAPQPESEGQRPVGMLISHLLDPQPTEVHVFISLHASIPLMVATVSNGHMWRVEHGKIELIDMSSPDL